MGVEIRFGKISAKDLAELLEAIVKVLTSSAAASQSVQVHLKVEWYSLKSNDLRVEG